MHPATVHQPSAAASTPPGEEGIFSARVRSAWHPPPRLVPSVWAERHIELPRGQSPRPGPLSHVNAPYLPGIIDLCVRPGVVQVNLMKSAQVGVSEALRWLMAYFAANEPDPMGLALPDRQKGEKIVQNRVIPLFARTPALRELATGDPHDQKKQQLRLANGWLLHLMWSGSPSAMASDPMRVVLCDEVDKFRLWAGREANPVALTAQRLEAFGDRGLQVNVSTPTTRVGQIWTLFDQSTIRLYYLVPCLHCRTRIRLLFPNVQFGLEGVDIPDRRERCDYLLRQRTAWYKCQACGARLSDADRLRMLQLGRWGTADADTGIADCPPGTSEPETGKVADALSVTRWPRGTRIAMHLSRLYTVWRSDVMSVLAARYIAALGDHAAMMTFRTQDLGEPFEDMAARTDSSALAARNQEEEHPEGLLPEWTARLVLTVDTQVNGFYAVLRAHGPGRRSQRIWHGSPAELPTLRDVDRIIDTPWKFAPSGTLPRDTPIPGGGSANPGALPETGTFPGTFPAMTIDLILIDSGGGLGRRLPGESDDEFRGRPTLTQQVYAWALQRHGRVRALKGMNNPQPGDTFRLGSGRFVTDDREERVPLWLVHSDHYQACLEEAMSARVELAAGDPATGELQTEPAWRLNARQDAEYNRQMCNMALIVERRSSGQMVRTWSPIAAGVRYDYRMCEVYQMAGLEMAGVHLLPDLHLFLAGKRAQLAAASQARRQPPRVTLTTPDGRPYLATER